MFDKHLRPALERGAVRRNLDRLARTGLQPGDVQVLQQDSPRHPVDRQVVDDQHQLTRRRHPQCAQHLAGRRVQPRPRRDHGVLGQLVDRAQVIRGIDRSHFGHLQRPARVGLQAQHRVPIHQGLQQHCDVGLGDARRGLHHHGLVELAGRAVHAGQPPHDRRRDHRPHTVVDDIGCVADGSDDQRQPGHRLLDEDVARPAGQAGSPRPGHHLHRHDAVAAQLEERVVHTDPLDAEDVGVDRGQRLLDRRARRPVLVDVAVGRSGQCPPVQLAVGGQRQRRQPHHGGRNHVRRKVFGHRDSHLGRVRGAGDVADQSLVPGTVLAHDHRGLPDAVQTGQCRLHVTQFDAVAANLDLLVGTAQVLQLTIAAPPHQVSGAVHALSRCAERARQEARGGQSTAPHVARRDTRAGHVQLTDHTDRHRAQPLVQDESCRPRRRGADRHRG